MHRLFTVEADIVTIERIQKLITESRRLASKITERKVVLCQME